MAVRQLLRLKPPGAPQSDRSAAEEFSDAGFATTLAKGLAVLEAFEMASTWLGNTELAARTGLTRPTAARLSHTLAELGYLRYDAAKSKYRLGARCARMTYPLLAALEFRQTARPLMQELAKSLGGTVSIGLLDADSCVYVETARSGDVGPHVPDVGRSVPIIRTAIGRALASMLQPAEAAALDARVKHEAPEDWSAFGAHYIAGRQQCFDQGISVSHGDWVSTIYAVATPLFRARATGDCFALNCGVPAFRLKPGQIDSEIGPRLKALAASIRLLAGETQPHLYAPPSSGQRMEQA
ncbi:MAG: IclR family transcriptional regulator [Hyphomicrobiales bacterium]|nr:IclR family transcriptional regulator [Hyphomicrobiales bacterium]